LLTPNSAPLRPRVVRSTLHINHEPLPASRRAMSLVQRPCLSEPDRLSSDEILAGWRSVRVWGRFKVAILWVYADLGAWPDRPGLKNVPILRRASTGSGTGPRHVCEALRDLARRVRAPVRWWSSRATIRTWGWRRWWRRATPSPGESGGCPGGGGGAGGDAELADRNGEPGVTTGLVRPAQTIDNVAAERQRALPARAVQTAGMHRGHQVTRVRVFPSGTRRPPPQREVTEAERVDLTYRRGQLTGTIGCGQMLGPWIWGDWTAGAC
jgi:hypothetical protein